MKKTDLEYLGEIRKGSKEYFELLFRKYYQSLVIFSNHFIDDKTAAEDIVQEFFTRMWEQRESIGIGGSVKNYLFRSIKNSTLNYITYNSKFSRNEKTQSLIETLHSLDPIDIDELEIEVINALNKLPERGREIFLLHYKDGYTYEEIAGMLGISKNTVKTHILRSKNTFGSKLEAILFVIPLLLE